MLPYAGIAYYEADFVNSGVGTSSLQVTRQTLPAQPS
jgi:hypothetical protein